MSKQADQFFIKKLRRSRGVTHQYPDIPAVRGVHLTNQQYDIIHQVIDNMKHPTKDKFYTMGLVAPRRAGKTSLIARLIPIFENVIKFDEPDPTDKEGKKRRYKTMDFFLGSMTQDKSISLYWDAVMKYSDEVGLGYKSSQKNSVITTPRGNHIRFKSLRDLKVASGGRGDRYVLLLIDEVQNIREDVLQEFLRVTKPATSDFGGTTILLGTMPHVPSGYWFDIINKRVHNTPCHFLRWQDNHFISGAEREAMIDDELAKANEVRGKESAFFRREWYGEQVWDKDSLAFMYNTRTNHYLEVDIAPKDREYVIGVDLGFNDADAFAVMCYSAKSPHVYLVEEEVRSRQDVTSCCEKIQLLSEKYGDPLVIVDSGSIGKKVLEEMINRYGVNAQAAEKSEKGGWIHVTRQHLHRGLLKIRQESHAVEEMSKVELNDNQDGWRKDGYHPDLLDAILYSFRYVYSTMHMFWKEASSKPRITNQVAYLESLMDKKPKKSKGFTPLPGIEDRELTQMNTQEYHHNMRGIF